MEEIMAQCFLTVGLFCLLIMDFLSQSLLKPPSFLIYSGVHFATFQPCWTRTCLSLAVLTLGAARSVPLCIYLSCENL